MKDRPTPEVEAPSASPATSGFRAGENAAPGSELKTGGAEVPAQRKSERYLLGGAWLLALGLVIFAAYLGWRARAQMILAPPSLPVQAGEDLAAREGQAAEVAADLLPVETPVFTQPRLFNAVMRLSNLHTIIPTRPREEVITYTVGTGDSVFGIAKAFNLQPESVLWANYDQLKDSPDMLTPGMILNIPPVDGVYYTWKEGDTIEGVASAFKAEAEDILSWSGNHLDLIDPQIKPGTKILIPGGKREFVQWVIPTIPRGRAGVSRSVYGPGACDGGYEGAYGSGFFVWPAANHFLSGNDYWSGHLGIDIAGATGDGIFASDSGVVVFSGWATGGYGYVIMIDHGNGYQTLYGHLSQTAARCGQSVYQGQYIGAMGSTGNSTGAHLHFEIRYMGGFINPWSMLPAP